MNKDMDEFFEYNNMFIGRGEGFDERSFVVNHACDIFYKRIKGKVEDYVTDLWCMYQGYDSTIRNFNELVHTQIPLMGYVELKKYGADNYGYSTEDYEKALNEYKEICREYYEE